MKLLHTLTLIVVISGALFLAPQQQAHAASNGCNAMNNLNGTLVWNEQKGSGNQDFWANDTIAIYLWSWDANGRVTVRINGPDGDHFFTTFPAVYYYHFDSPTNASFSVANMPDGDRTRVTVSALCNGYAALPTFADGRINMEVDQTAAIYCYRGGVVVSRIIASKGYPSLRVSAATIAKVPKNPAQNTLIAEDKRYKVRLYRLTSGELQINATSFEGKPDYVYIWNGCDSG